MLEIRLHTTSKGFLLCWYSMFGQPETEADWKTNVQVLFICSTAFRLPNVPMISDLLRMFIQSASIAENRC
jgi:antibiotic biosynthesis monooxygenase (ABM) superfamily enzyme